MLSKHISRLSLKMNRPSAACLDICMLHAKDQNKLVMVTGQVRSPIAARNRNN